MTCLPDHTDQRPTGEVSGHLSDAQGGSGRDHCTQGDITARVYRSCITLLVVLTTITRFANPGHTLQCIILFNFFFFAIGLLQLRMGSPTMLRSATCACHLTMPLCMFL